jgi:hypothetical protein
MNKRQDLANHFGIPQNAAMAIPAGLDAPAMRKSLIQHA